MLKMYQQNAGFLNFNKNNDIFLKTYRKQDYNGLLFMLENKMIPNFGYSDKYGNTILHYTCYNGDIEFIQLILEQSRICKFINIISCH